MGKSHYIDINEDFYKITVKSTIPHSPLNLVSTPESHILGLWGRIRDAVNTKKPYMKPYTIPVIRTTNPKKWYVEFYYNLPQELIKPGCRKSKRFKIYAEINKLSGAQREAYAERLRKSVEYALTNMGWNPFNDMVEYSSEIEVAKNINEEEFLKDTPVLDAVQAYIQSKADGGKERKTITTYNQSKALLAEYLDEKGILQIPINKIKRVHIEEALNMARKKKDWGAVTYNNQLRNLNTIFNWLVIKDYIISSPIKGKIEYMKEEKSINKWYDRDTARVVKKELLDQGELSVYRACAFTYWLMIRSRKELHELKVGDIDRKLKRIRFRKEITKNKQEAFRDYSEEFEKILDDMEIDKYPADYYIFGSGSSISEFKARKDLLAKKFKVVRDKLGLSNEYTIYGWKHTRVIHLMMQGVDGYEISYLARHKDTKSTEAYKRDYDFTRTHVYSKEDLTF